MRRVFAIGVAVLALAGVNSPASAADIGPAPVYTKAPVAAPVPYYDWSGFYIGGHGGWAWGNKDWTDDGGANGIIGAIPGASLGSHDIDGWLAGGQVGF